MDQERFAAFLDVAGVDGAIFYRPKDKGDQVFSHGVSPQKKRSRGEAWEG